MSSFTIPTLETERLVLRAPEWDDFPAYAEVLGSKHAVHMEGPHDRDAAWDLFCDDVAAWVLQGFGGLMIVAGDEVVGRVALGLPPWYPEVELGWLVYPRHTGRGYATEAARALRDWGFHSAKLPTMVSYIDPANGASRGVAEHLGAKHDPEAPLPDGETNEDTLVYRHPLPSTPAGARTERPS